MTGVKKSGRLPGLLIVPAVSLLLAAAGIGPAGASGDEVIAVLDGAPITLSEIEENAAFQIYRLRGSIHSLLEREAREIADRRLLEREAARRGLSVEALLKEEVDGRVAPLRESDIDAYLAAHPEEAVRGAEGRARLRTYLEERGRIQRRLDYVASLREKSDYRFLASPPERPRIRVATEGAPWRGTAGAPVTLVHFAHFSSPVCAESAGKIRRLMEEFPGKIRWVHRSFLGTQDADALRAAETGEGAFRQGRFWEYHDAILARGGRATAEAIRQAAREAGLDMQRLADEQGRGILLLRVREDIGHGVRIGVQAAPVIFVNGIYMSGTFPYEDLRALVLREIEGTRKESETGVQETSSGNTGNRKGGRP
ncbi:MAG: thioredoxin domain-containing protein [Syntrophaceae bacterium]|nr:thioredoxin domain-containing protein [Syntrophaceae bacterium]